MVVLANELCADSERTSSAQALHSCRAVLRDGRTADPTVGITTH